SLHERPRTFRQRAEAVAADVVCNMEGVAREAVQKIAAQSFARSERDGVHQPIQAVPAFADLGIELLNLLVARYVAWKDEIAAELGRERYHTVVDAFALISEGQGSTFALHRLGDAVGDRAIAQHAGNQDLL